MSIERSEFLKWPEAKFIPQLDVKSPISKLAGEIIAEGVDGLIASNRGSSSPLGVTTVLERPDSVKSGDLGQYDYIARIALGFSIKSIEETLVNKEFDLYNFIEGMNFHLGSIAAIKMPRPDREESIEKIPTKKYTAMLEIAQRDHTLAAHMENDALLPELLKKKLTDINMMHPVRALLPLYRKTARERLGKSRTYHFETKKRLSEIDSFISHLKR